MDRPSLERVRTLTMSLQEALASARRLTPLEVLLLGSRNQPSAEHGRQLLPPPSPFAEQGSRSQKLLDPIIVLIAKEFIHDPKDVFHLALTNKNLYGYLKLEMYRTEVLRTKEEERAVMFARHSIALPFNITYNIEERVRSILDTVTTDLADPKERWAHHTMRLNIPGKPNALHHAAKKGNKDVITRLINASARYWPGYIEAKYSRCTALVAAVFQNQQEMVELLVEAGAFVDMWVDELKGLRKFGRSGGCNFVLSLNVQPEHYANERTMWSPLTCAIAKRRPDQALFLAQHTRDAGLVPNFIGGNVLLQVSALHLAAFAGMTGVVKALLERGYTRDMRSALFKDATALEMAAMGTERNYDVMRLLGHDKVGDEMRSLAWRRAIVYRNPRNAIFLLQESDDQGRLLLLCDEARLCLECDALLPVLKFILARERNYDVLINDLREAAAELIDNTTGIPSATYQYLRDKGLIDRPAEANTSSSLLDRPGPVTRAAAATAAAAARPPTTRY
ncbi:hypothetical protein LQW54_009636 [Pestalotiopsis sp. IQ-011]